jgi:hypothetical protein
MSKGLITLLLMILQPDIAGGLRIGNATTKPGA